MDRRHSIRIGTIPPIRWRLPYLTIFWQRWSRLRFRFPRNFRGFSSAEIDLSRHDFLERDVGILPDTACKDGTL